MYIHGGHREHKHTAPLKLLKHQDTWGTHPFTEQQLTHLKNLSIFIAFSILRLTKKDSLKITIIRAIGEDAEGMHKSYLRMEKLHDRFSGLPSNLHCRGCDMELDQIALFRNSAIDS